jgi:thiol-disulfide isomerase/thioredoxin
MSEKTKGAKLGVRMKNIVILLPFCLLFLTGLCQSRVLSKYRAVHSSRDMQDDSAHIIILPNYDKINTLQDVLVHMKGKPVYVDLWATWCEPCLKNFALSDSLYMLLKENGVGLLYISLDIPEKDSLWRSIIISYNLRGTHIRANKLLQDEITMLIWNGIDVYSIPHYLIFDDNGQVLSKDAPSLKDGEKLKSMLNHLSK